MLWILYIFIWSQSPKQDIVLNRKCNNAVMVIDALQISRLSLILLASENIMVWQ